MATVTCTKCGAINSAPKQGILRIIGAIILLPPISLLILCLPKRGKCFKCQGEIKTAGMKLA